MRNTQYGFGLVLGLIVLVLVASAVIGVYGWVQYSNRGNTDAPSSSSSNSNGQSDARELATDGESERGMWATIEDWGLKVVLRDYKKVGFKVSEEPGTLVNGDTYDGKASPYFKPEFLQDKSCSPGLDLFRSKTGFSDYTAKKIGEYHYVITGGPGPCSDAPDGPDDRLKRRFLDDFTLENLTVNS